MSLLNVNLWRWVSKRSQWTERVSENSALLCLFPNTHIRKCKHKLTQKTEIHVVRLLIHSLTLECAPFLLSFMLFRMFLLFIWSNVLFYSWVETKWNTWEYKEKFQEINLWGEVNCVKLNTFPVNKALVTTQRRNQHPLTKSARTHSHSIAHQLVYQYVFVYLNNEYESNWIELSEQAQWGPWCDDSKSVLPLYCSSNSKKTGTDCSGKTQILMKCVPVHREQSWLRMRQ